MDFWVYVFFIGQFQFVENFNHFKSLKLASTFARVLQNLISSLIKQRFERPVLSLAVPNLWTQLLKAPLWRNTKMEHIYMYFGSSS